MTCREIQFNTSFPYDLTIISKAHLCALTMPCNLDVAKVLYLSDSLTLLKIVTDHHLVVCLESLFCEPINQKLNIYNSNGVKCAHVSLICLDE